MKKGFTLIELLAVIVILAIIALIATPIVISIIDDTKESATLNSAGFYLDAVETVVMTKNMNSGGNFNPSSCDVLENGNLKCDDYEEQIKVEVNGEMPDEGTIIFENGNIKEAIVKYDKKTLKQKSNGEIVFAESIIKTDVACAKPGGATCTDEEIIEGILVNVQVNENKNLDFYVIADDGTTLTLITKDPIEEKTVWVTQTDFANSNIPYDTKNCPAWAGYDGSCRGPLTALNLLETYTNDWKNINEFTYILNDDSSVGWYTNVERKNVRARMLSMTDAKRLGCIYGVSNSCPKWISSNNTKTQWTSTGSGDHRRYVISIYNSYFQSITIIGENYIYPVITLSKTD